MHNEYAIAAAVRRAVSDMGWKYPEAGKSSRPQFIVKAMVYSAFVHFGRFAPTSAAGMAGASRTSVRRLASEWGRLSKSERDAWMKLVWSKLKGKKQWQRK